MPELYEPLEKYVEDNFKGKVKIFHNLSRLGLIATRMKGAKLASGEVIVFLDSHMEVITNWLPPLLEPIVINRKTATVPVIDNILYDNFEYQVLSDSWDGGFDWNLRYQYFVFSDAQYPVHGKPHVLAAMTGGAYAIDRRYFFELGGYDKGLYLYNGENYEISFKLHMCGGNLMKIPCSRVGTV